MKRRDRHLSNGFTIIELMVAMLLGLLLSGAIVTLFVNNRHSFDRDESIARMQDGARQAVRDLANDLSMAGFWADLVLPRTIFGDGSLVIGTDCGPAGVPNWVYQVAAAGTGDSLAVALVDNATGATANAAFSCITAGEIVPGTDVIAVKRIAGATIAGAPTNGNVYLRTNGTFGLLYRVPEAAPPAVVIPAPFSEWEYRPSIYYVRNFAITAGDGVPTLCRKVLQYAALPRMVTECLAQGIEDLQVEFGLDDDGDGEPNVYVPAPTLAQLQMAVSAQIHVLARSVEQDIQYTNEKTYQLSNAAPHVPADNFYRRVFSVTVGMLNLSSLRTLRS